MLLAYTILGSNDLARTKAFWGPVMECLGAAEHPSFSSETRVWYARGEAGLLAIGLPHDGMPATAGNGAMVALAAADTATVAAAHQKALDLGAGDEGQPGVRTGNWYGAYFRDPDGNKVAVFTLV